MRPRIQSLILQAKKRETQNRLWTHPPMIPPLTILRPPRSTKLPTEPLVSEPLTNPDGSCSTGRASATLPTFPCRCFPEAGLWLIWTTGTVLSQDAPLCCPASDRSGPGCVKWPWQPRGEDSLDLYHSESPWRLYGTPPPHTASDRSLH